MGEDQGHYRRGVELLKAGRLDEAIDELEIAATSGDDLPVEHFALGVAYAKAGDKVAKGQTLLIIEAMKVMNPIPAPHGGTVQDILFGDGRPVEYGEVLLVVA